MAKRQQTIKWKIVGKNSDHVTGATITSSVDPDSDGWVYKYTATIRGWRGWVIAVGSVGKGDFAYEDVLKRVQEIRDRIDANDDEVFKEKQHPLGRN